MPPKGNSKYLAPHKRGNRRGGGGQKTGQAGGGDLISRGGGGANTTVIERWLPVFPASVTKKLRYSTTFSLATTSGAITATYVFRANDLFDPDFQTGGHQPMGFDQLMLWYNHFLVRRARIWLVVKNLGATSPTVCLRVDGDSGGITVIDRIVELGGCVTETLQWKGTYGANIKMSMSVDIAKLQGVRPAAMTADANLRGTAAASPIEVTYFHITAWDTIGATGSMEVDVILEQEATFFEPRDVTESLYKKKSVPEQIHLHNEMMMGQPREKGVTSPWELVMEADDLLEVERAEKAALEAKHLQVRQDRAKEALKRLEEKT